MFRKDLIAAIADRMNITRDCAADFVGVYESVIFDTLNSGENINLTNFAKYEVVTVPGRKRYNIAVDDVVYAAPKYRLKIAPTGKLKNSIEEQEVSAYERRKFGNKDEDGDDE